MLRYLAGRVAQATFVVWAAFTATFVILWMLPADPVLLMLNQEGGTSLDPEVVAELRARHGLDRPVVVQYLDRLTSALRGDLGTSLHSGRPVATEIAEALPETLTLAAAAFVLAVGAGTAIALVATYTRRRWLSQLLLSLPPLGVAVPGFWLGILLLQVLSFRWGLLPAGGNRGVESLILPAVTLAVPTTATVAQVLAKSLSDTWTQAHVVTARAKGASRIRVHLGHAFRNASLPAVTIVGMVVGTMLSGAVVTETIFTRAGIGRLTQKAVETQDIPMVQALVVLAAVIFVVVSLAVDLLYPLLDPRIRRRTAARTS
ncbi:ABC transporter permease [Pseudonocardia kongjuensis]|uniref:ABC transporter permease n=1 Tax=Pseudonocardia kongjuensis TaxID=102227 RepID=A0ABN1Y1Z1_9PSEU